MFDVATTLMSQLVTLLPGMIGIYILFDLTGALLFGKR